MLQLLKAILLGKAIALSPAVASIGGSGVTYTAKEPIAALNAGARVSIDVSSVVPVTDAMETMRKTEGAFPRGCIRATGVGPGAALTKLTEQSIAYSPNGAFVQLSQVGGAKANVKFSSIIISSCRTIPTASVTWLNYGDERPG